MLTFEEKLLIIVLSLFLAFVLTSCAATNVPHQAGIPKVKTDRPSINEQINRIIQLPIQRQ